VTFCTGGPREETLIALRHCCCSHMMDRLLRGAFVTLIQTSDEVPPNVLSSSHKELPQQIHSSLSLGVCFQIHYLSLYCVATTKYLRPGNL
jgi:hypothetical protein